MTSSVAPTGNAWKCSVQSEFWAIFLCAVTRKVGLPTLFWHRKMLVKWWNANENCEAILGGQNAGFALLF